MIPLPPVVAKWGVKAAPWVIGAVSLISIYLVWRGAERAKGAKDATIALLTAQVESTRKADSVASVIQAQVAREAVRRADSSEAALRAHQARDRALAASTDSAVRAAGAERQAALKLAADSAATTGQLRAEIRQLVRKEVADSAANARERASLKSQLSDAMRVIDDKNRAIAEKDKALAAANKQAADDSKEIRLLKQASGGSSKLLVGGIGAVLGALGEYLARR